MNLVFDRPKSGNVTHGPFCLSRITVPAPESSACWMKRVESAASYPKSDTFTVFAACFPSWPMLHGVNVNSTVAFVTGFANVTERRSGLVPFLPPLSRTRSSHDHSPPVVATATEIFERLPVSVRPPGVLSARASVVTGTSNAIGSENSTSSRTVTVPRARWYTNLRTSRFSAGQE